MLCQITEKQHTFQCFVKLLRNNTLSNALSNYWETTHFPMLCQITEVEIADVFMFTLSIKLNGTYAFDASDE